MHFMKVVFALICDLQLLFLFNIKRFFSLCINVSHSADCHAFCMTDGPFLQDINSLI